MNVLTVVGHARLICQVVLHRPPRIVLQGDQKRLIEGDRKAEAGPDLLDDALVHFGGRSHDGLRLLRMLVHEVLGLDQGPEKVPDRLGILAYEILLRGNVEQRGENVRVMEDDGIRSKLLRNLGQRITPSRRRIDLPCRDVLPHLFRFQGDGLNVPPRQAIGRQ